MRRPFKNSFNRQCIVKLDWKFKRIRRAKSRDIPNLKRIKIKIKIKTILDRSILHFPYLEILYLQSSRSSSCKLILARDLRKWVQRELPRRINEIYAGELNERKAFDRRRGFIFIGMIFRLHLPFASPSIIFSRISLVSSEFSYIRLILSFYSIERNISFRDTKRNNLFSYLSTLRTSSNEMRTKMGRGNFSLAFASTRPE